MQNFNVFMKHKIIITQYVKFPHDITELQKTNNH